MSCKCLACGNQFKIDIIVSDKIWETIKPNGASTEGGLLCPACIIKKLESIHGYHTYMLIKG